jgi:hypothetical protein
MRDWELSPLLHGALGPYSVDFIMFLVDSECRQLIEAFR